MTNIYIRLGLILVCVSCVACQQADAPPVADASKIETPNDGNVDPADVETTHKADEDTKTVKSDPVVTTPNKTKPETDSPTAKKPANGIVVEVADGNIRFNATESWEVAKPKNNVVKYEMKIPKTDGQENDGRLTISGAGGSLEANIARWRSQFAQPDGSSTEDHTTVSEKEINGQVVNIVSITGTFLDSAGQGPFAGGKKIERKDYRMLGAIIQTAKDGNYFVKLYGPKSMIDKNESHFNDMINSVNVAE